MLTYVQATYCFSYVLLLLHYIGTVHIPRKGVRITTGTCPLKIVGSYVQLSRNTYNSGKSRHVNYIIDNNIFFMLKYLMLHKHTTCIGKVLIYVQHTMFCYRTDHYVTWNTPLHTTYMIMYTCAYNFLVVCVLLL